MTNDVERMPRDNHGQPATPARLLLVDDDAPIINSLTWFLKREGHQVDTAEGSQAIEMLAIAYYNLQRGGLGLEFASEIKRTLGRILAFPTTWTQLSARTRRCRTTRFPYAIMCQVRGDLILVVAVQNLHRHPDSWKSRLRRDAE